MMERLISPCPRIKGCQVPIPETAFYTEKGRPEYIMRTDKEDCLYPF